MRYGAKGALRRHTQRAGSRVEPQGPCTEREPSWGAAPGICLLHSWPVPTPGHLPCSPRFTSTQISNSLPQVSPSNPAPSAAARLHKEGTFPLPGARRQGPPWTCPAHLPHVPDLGSTRSPAWLPAGFQNHVAMCMPCLFMLRTRSPRLHSPQEGLCISW